MHHCYGLIRLIRQLPVQRHVGIDLTIEIGSLVLGRYQDQAESGFTHVNIGRFVSLA
jgi:hypothetical protein